MSPHYFTNFEIQKYYRNETKFNCAYARNNLPNIKDEAYVINLDEYQLKGTHWIAVYINNNDVTYFENFAVKHSEEREI